MLNVLYKATTKRMITKGTIACKYLSCCAGCKDMNTRYVEKTENSNMSVDFLYLNIEYTITGERRKTPGRFLTKSNG